MFHLSYHNILILRADTTQAPREEVHDLYSRELLHDQAHEVLNSYNALNHRITEDRIAKRFNNGLRFIQLWRNSELLGFTWIVVNGGRYIDEAGYNLDIRNSEFWVRDVYVSPSARGQRMFSKLMQLISTVHVPGCTVIWSDVDWDNNPSLKAHYSYGFKAWARVRSLKFRHQFIIRSSPPPWQSPITTLKPKHSLLFLDRDTVRTHNSLIA